MRLAPHTDGMSGGRSPPKPSHRVGVWGNPVSPHPSSRAYVHVSPPCGSAAQHRNEHKVLPGRAAPSQPSHRVGAWGNPVPPYPCGAGAWGNPVSPHPSPRAYVHVSPPCDSAAQHRNEHKVLPGRAQPSQTLPPGGGMGKPGSPTPLAGVEGPGPSHSHPPRERWSASCCMER